MTNSDRPFDSTLEELTEFVARFGEGDARPVDQVRRRIRRILAYSGWGIPPEDQLDLEQNILWQLLQAVEKEDFNPGGFWKFVEIVASRRCIDWRRAQRQNVALEDINEPGDSAPTPLKATLRKEQLEQARAVLAELPAKCRELIRLHMAEGKTYREIAEILGETEGALRVRMHRCIERARVQLQQGIRGDTQRQNEPPKGGS